MRSCHSVRSQPFPSLRKQKKLRKYAKRKLSQEVEGELLVTKIVLKKRKKTPEANRVQACGLAIKIFLINTMKNLITWLFNPHLPLRLIARKNKNSWTLGKSQKETKANKPQTTPIFQPITWSKDLEKCSPLFSALLQRTRTSLEWLEPKWTRVQPSKFARFYSHKTCLISVNELESVLLFVIEETVMDDFKDPQTKDIHYKVLLNALLMPFFQLRTRILEKHTYFEIGDI